MREAGSEQSHCPHSGDSDVEAGIHDSSKTSHYRVVEPGLTQAVASAPRMFTWTESGVEYQD